MELKEFKYLNRTYKPLKTLKGKESDFFEICKHQGTVEFTPQKWNYNKFYEIAKKNGAGKIDIFIINVKGIEYQVIPGTNYLFVYK